jgi:hypothetical protein
LAKVPDADFEAALERSREEQEKTRRVSEVVALFPFLRGWNREAILEAGKTLSKIAARDRDRLGLLFAKWASENQRKRPGDLHSPPCASAEAETLYAVPSKAETAPLDSRRTDAVNHVAAEIAITAAVGFAALAGIAVYRLSRLRDVGCAGGADFGSFGPASGASRGEKS